MISICIASKALCKENREISVRLVLPLDEKTIWNCVEKTETQSLDDCFIVTSFSDSKGIDNFLSDIMLWDEDVFTLNYFARLLETMTKTETERFLYETYNQGFGCISEAVQWFLKEVSL